MQGGVELVPTKFMLGWPVLLLGHACLKGR